MARVRLDIDDQAPRWARADRKARLTVELGNVRLLVQVEPDEQLVRVLVGPRLIGVLSFGDITLAEADARVLYPLTERQAIAVLTQEHDGVLHRIAQRMGHERSEG